MRPVESRIGRIRGLFVVVRSVIRSAPDVVGDEVRPLLAQAPLQRHGRALIRRARRLFQLVKRRQAQIDVTQTWQMKTPNVRVLNADGGIRIQATLGSDRELAAVGCRESGIWAID